LEEEKMTRGYTKRGWREKRGKREEGKKAKEKEKGNRETKKRKGRESPLLTSLSQVPYYEDVWVYDFANGNWAWIFGDQGVGPTPPYDSSYLDRQQPIHRVEAGYDLDATGSKREVMKRRKGEQREQREEREKEK
jgi:hypothetical protein